MDTWMHSHKDVHILYTCTMTETWRNIKAFTRTHTHARMGTHTHTHTHTHIYFFSHILGFTLTSHTNTHTHRHTRTFTLGPSCMLYITHIQKCHQYSYPLTNTLTVSHLHTQTLSLSFYNSYSI